MKTAKKIRASFSADANLVSLTLPHGWQWLADHELLRIYQMMEHYDSDMIRFYVFTYLTGLRIRKRKQYEEGRFFCSIKAQVGEQTRKIELWLNGSDMVGWLDELDWLFEPGCIPVRVAKMRGIAAINAKLYDTPFEVYLQLENLYQGFISSRNVDALSAIYRLLYPSPKEQWHMLSPIEITNVLQWVVQIKNMFARQFRNLFRPGGQGEAPNMVEVMNNEIRALTGGDITKEAVVRQVDTWRALTELDFKAKEAEDFRREQAKIKNR